jgi:hypothetical protein
MEAKWIYFVIFSVVVISVVTGIVVVVLLMLTPDNPPQSTPVPNSTKPYEIGNVILIVKLVFI